MEHADGFSPFKAVLEAIATNYKVCTWPRAQDHSLTNRLQESLAVGNAIECSLSDIATLDTLFAMPPGNVVDQRHRSELLRYVIYPPPPIRLGVDFSPVSSKVSKYNCGLCLKSQGYRDLQTLSKIMKWLSGSSRIYERLSATTRFVRNY